MLVGVQFEAFLSSTIMNWEFRNNHKKVDLWFAQPLSSCKLKLQ